VSTSQLAVVAHTQQVCVVWWDVAACFLHLEVSSVKRSSYVAIFFYVHLYGIVVMITGTSVLQDQ
jgi:hypothetical protein